MKGCKILFVSITQQVKTPCPVQMLKVPTKILENNIMELLEKGAVMKVGHTSMGRF